MEREGKQKCLKFLKDAIRKHTTGGQDMLNKHYPEPDGYPYKFRGHLNRPNKTSSSEKMRAIMELESEDE